MQVTIFHLLGQDVHMFIYLEGTVDYPESEGSVTDPGLRKENRKDDK